MLGARNTERGASLVEFALILPVLVALIVGLLTGGIAYSRKISMENAVREGTRFGATLDVGPTDWANIVRTRVVEISGGDLDVTRVCVELVEILSGGGEAAIEKNTSPACSLSGEPSPPANVAGGTCLVKVWAERDSRLEAFFFSQELRLTAEAVGRYERLSCP